MTNTKQKINKMNTYCVKCKKNAENIDPKMFGTKKIIDFIMMIMMIIVMFN